MRILLIAYYYPPLGGPASIRLGKTVKYLRRLGWTVDVISVKNIMYHSYDYALAEECRPDGIIRTNSLEILALLSLFDRLIKLLPFQSSGRKKQRSCRRKKLYFSFPDSLRDFFKKLLFPDEKIGWLPFACKKGYACLKKVKYDYLITSIGPYTAGIIAYMLSKKTDTPLLIDYRDHWTLHPYKRFSNPIHHKMSAAWERRILKQASLVTTAGKTMTSELLSSFPEIDKNSIREIYNGYDDEDFSAASASFYNPERVQSEKKSNRNSLDQTEPEEEPRNEVIFTYTGSLYLPITPLYLIKALKNLHIEGKLPSALKIRFIGNYHRDMYNLLSDKALSGCISIIPNLPHKETVAEIMKSDVLLLLLSSSEGKGILTTKAFEYIRSGKPILALIPENAEIAEVIGSFNNHYICPMEDSEQTAGLILTAFNDVLSNRKKGYCKPESNNNRINEFSREKQTMKLSSFLQENLHPE